MVLTCALAGSAGAGTPDACELRFPKPLAHALLDADFDGDGSLDVAAVMPSRTEASPLLVAARYRRGAWDVRSLPFWSTTPGRAYVQPLQPGTYRRTKSVVPDPDSPAERRSVTSSRIGFVSGTVESTGVAYFYDGGSWIYVWIANAIQTVPGGGFLALGTGVSL